MTKDKPPPREGHSEGHSEGHLEPLGFSDVELELLESAKQENPSETLETRVLSGLRNRRELAVLTEAPAPRRRAPWVLLAAAVMLGGLAFWLPRQRSVPVGPELLTASRHGAVSSAPVRASSEPRSPAPRTDPCAGAPRASGQQPLIDDFEDGDDAVRPFEQRSALWRWSRDTDLAGSAPALLPIPRLQANPQNRQAAHVKGGQLRDWGALVEMRFEPSCYNASAYAGLVFSARGKGRIYVSPREVSVMPRELGGSCDKDCYNGHVFKVELTDHWTTVELRWEQFEQRGYGRAPLDPARLHDLAFLVRPEDTPYDLWLDDVRFLKK